MFVSSCDQINLDLVSQPLLVLFAHDGLVLIPVDQLKIGNCRVDAGRVNGLKNDNMCSKTTWKYFPQNQRKARVLKLTWESLPQVNTWI